MIKNYNFFIKTPLIKESKNVNYLNYYIFDWDDNILVMPTKILLDKFIDGEWKPIEVSTKEFSEIRKYIDDYDDGKESIWRFRNNVPNEAFSEFRDWGKRGENAFFEDTLYAIKNNNFGPVWDIFIECLTGGHIFMIITARGHEPNTIMKSIKWIINKYLSDDQKEEMEKNLRKFNLLFEINDVNLNFDKLVNNYLNMCYFIGITSEYFKELFDINDRINTEKSKAMAIRYFTMKVNDYGKKINRKVKVGFSDDDSSTVQHVYRYLKDQLWYEIPIDYYVYHTKDGIKRL